ncbi:Zinc finger BED domain-containing protein DAYSLEEPER [Rhynchospora pubera]|uniref:Zinc finger BED domain-containing protein DAYSLEEPER n=1 Tax=Rhynchospora pubera TaxID=906938 RepID=A0AAV8EW00_9POAL|nr:Zinc finger BED domain-containing protein DAYSLEEPER [Rhynchospora pubera]
MSCSIPEKNLIVDTVQVYNITSMIYCLERRSIISPPSAEQCHIRHLCVSQHSRAVRVRPPSRGHKDLTNSRGTSQLVVAIFVELQDMVDTRAAKRKFEVEAEPDEPDISDDDMRPGLELETPEEIQRIIIDAYGPQQAKTPSPQKTSKKRKRKGPREDNHTSEVWAHFTRGPKDDGGSLDASCNYCGKKYKQGNQRSTSSLWHHFERGCDKVPRSKRVKPDAKQRLLQAGKATAAGPNPAVWKFDQARSRKNFGKMVIAHDYPFNCATHHYLKVFVSELQPLFKMVSKTTVRADCLSIYEEEKVALYEFFSKLDCRFSFTSDLWTSKGRDKGFMALTCHYIDDAWKLRKRLIGFITLPSPHTGKHIAQAIHDSLVLWNLDKKAFSLVLDNSSANDASITELFNTTSIQKNLPVSGTIFHQRCACHILNLIVQDGLSVLCDEIENVRETMKYICHSQARMEKFSLAVRQVGAPNKKPAWDVQTRWNSTYLMLELALELREAINRYATLDKSYTSKPSEQEWEKVKALVQCLKPFYDAALKLSGIKYPTLNLFFPEFCEVYLSIKKMSSSPQPFVVQMSLEMFSKWDKYWKDGNIILAIACMLDPRCKLTVVEYYMEQMYPEDCATYMNNMKNCMNELFKDYVQAHSKLVQNQADSSTQQLSTPAALSDTRAGLRDVIRAKKNAGLKSEVEEYFTEPLDEASLDDHFDILAWWKLKAPKYPVLARLTRDILAVPISTVASESTFNTSGRTLNPGKSSLNDESMEALVCAQDWLKAAVIENGGELGDPLWPVDDGVGADGSATLC